MTPSTSSGSDAADQLAAEIPPDDPRVGDGLHRRRLFGYDFVDAPGLEPVLDAVLQRPPSPSHEVLPVLVTPNVDIVVQLDRSPDSVEADVTRRAQYVLPDGMPIVACSRFLGRPLGARLTGSGLFEILWPALVAQDRAVLVLSASAAIAGRLGREAPRSRFVVPPQFEDHDGPAVEAVVDDLLAAAAESRPDMVLLGLGHPKDPIVAARFLARWNGGLASRPLVCCMGGSFAMYAGFRRRAPRWMQQAGLEWFYRFVQEPRRLFRRYFVRDLAFVGIVARARREARVQSQTYGPRP